MGLSPLLTWSVSVCLASCFGCQTSACWWEQKVIKPEGWSTALVSLFKSICLSELTSYIMRCDLGADMSSVCSQRSVPFLKEIISTRPLSVCRKEEKSCRLCPHPPGCPWVTGEQMGHVYWSTPRDGTHCFESCNSLVAPSQRKPWTERNSWSSGEGETNERLKDTIWGVKLS